MFTHFPPPQKKNLLFVVMGNNCLRSSQAEVKELSVYKFTSTPTYGDNGRVLSRQEEMWKHVSIFTCTPTFCENSIELSCLVGMSTLIACFCSLSYQLCCSGKKLWYCKTGPSACSVLFCLLISVEHLNLRTPFQCFPCLITSEKRPSQTDRKKNSSIKVQMAPEVQQETKTFFSSQPNMVKSLNKARLNANNELVKFSDHFTFCNLPFSWRSLSFFPFSICLSLNS